MSDNPSPIALFIGIDWADQEHEANIIDRQGKRTVDTFAQTPEAIDAWVAAMLAQADGGAIGIILEQKQGGLIHALMFRENVVLFPINPKQLAHYRESYSNAGGKNDESDAWLLAQLLSERHTLLSPWQPDDETTRALARLCQNRRKMVNEKTRLVQQLTDQLKAYFPQVLQLKSGNSVTPLMLAVLRRWPDPRKLQRADRRVLHKVIKQHSRRNEERRNELIEQLRGSQLLSRDRALLEPAAILVKTWARQIELLHESIAELEQAIETEMNQHPDAALFTALPGAGKALAPRLLVAFGSDRDRFANAEEVATLAGIAPVTKQSGKSRHVHRRFACSKFLRQTFHEFADHARKWCPWSRAYYLMQRDRGMKHHAALRKLAYRWIRILFRVWKDRRPYDADAYLATIRRKNPRIIPFLATPKTT
jgi:transposase